jgi:hypothetical protein
MKIICESMYQYVLAGDKTLFCVMMQSLSDQMLQDTFHWCIRAYLKKYGVGQCVYILDLYQVCTQYILGLYLTKLVRTCTKHTSIFHQV